MQTTSPHPHLNYHTWKDLGGPLGLVLDGAFFVFVLISASFMLLFCSVLLGLDYALAPLLALGSRIPASHHA